MWREAVLISPEVGLSRLAIRFNKVLLPHPEAPTIETNSPWLTDIVKSSSTKPGVDSKDLCKPAISIVGFIVDRVRQNLQPLPSSPLIVS